MFSKKKVAPVMQRSRFAKAKPKIVPKSSQSKNEKDLSKSSGEEKGSEPLSPVANKKASHDTSSTSESVSLNEEVKSPSCESVDEVSPNRGNLNKVSTDAREQEKPSPSKKEHENLDKNSSPQEESENQIYNGNQEPPVASTTPLSVARTETSPVKNSSLKELNKHTENENSYFSPNYEQRPKTIELVEKVIPSPIKTSVVSSTDKSLKYPCLTKILAAPKKRPHNKEMNERKKKMASYKELPPRNEMTFTDLIYWNPNTAPMKKKEKSLTVFDPIEQQTAAEEELDEDDDDASIAPKLFVNENGEIIVDETSLVRERKKTFVDMNAEAVILDDSDVTYATFRRKVSKKWSPKETVNFYKALSVIGTDFALMESIIPNRTRRELKIKFKKEEKINMELLHRAMYETDTFQSELSVEGLDLEVIDIPGLEESVADSAEASNGKKHRKRKSQVLSEIASNDGSNENDSQPFKKGRGRPKGKKNACNTSHAENSFPPIEPDDDCSVESSPLVRKKRVTTLLRDSVELSDNAIIEDDEASPIMRKKKTRILSQSSQEDDYCEIQVQINALTDEDIYNPNVNENVCLESSINPEESPTEYTGLSTYSYVRLQKLPIPEEMISLASKSPLNSNSILESPKTDHGPLEILSIKKEKLGSPSLPMRNEFLSPANKQTETPTTPEPPISKSSNSPVNPKATLQRGRKLNIKPNVKLQKFKNVSSESTALSSCNDSPNVESIGCSETVVRDPIDIISVKKEKFKSTLQNEPINKQTEKTIASKPSISVSSSDSSTKSAYQRGRKLNVKPNVKLPKCKSANPQPVKFEQEVRTDYNDPESLTVISILDEQVLSEGATDVVTTPAVSRRQKTKGALKGSPDNNQKRSLPSSFSYTPVMEPETDPPCVRESSTSRDEPRFVRQPRQHTHSRTQPQNNQNCLLPSSVNYTPVMEPESDPTCVRESTSCDEPRFVRQLRQQTYSRMQSDAPLANVGSPSYNIQASPSLVRSSSSPLVTTLNTSSNRILSIPITPEMSGGNETVMIVNPSPNGKSFHFFVPNLAGSTPLPPEVSAPPSRIRRPDSFSLVE
nr:mediator of DNA damage checkpoint protein 1 isoform X3 [Parasteatoda tepidariorum]